MNSMFGELSLYLLCLSRACLGKIILWPAVKSGKSPFARTISAIVAARVQVHGGSSAASSLRDVWASVVFHWRMLAPDSS